MLKLPTRIKDSLLLHIHLLSSKVYKADIFAYYSVETETDGIVTKHSHYYLNANH